MVMAGSPPGRDLLGAFAGRLLSHKWFLLVCLVCLRGVFVFYLTNCQGKVVFLFFLEGGFRFQPE